MFHRGSSGGTSFWGNQNWERVQNVYTSTEETRNVPRARLKEGGEKRKEKKKRHGPGLFRGRRAKGWGGLSWPLYYTIRIISLALSLGSFSSHAPATTCRLTDTTRPRVYSGTALVLALRWSTATRATASNCLCSDGDTAPEIPPGIICAKTTSCLSAVQRQMSANSDALATKGTPCMFTARGVKWRRVLGNPSVKRKSRL